MSLRVLLADESASIRKVFQMGLQDFGAEVKSVHNGLDVIQVAENYNPHIIFADILLQKKSGYEVSSEVRDHDSLKSVPVVLMWSSFMELDHKKYESCGAQGELEKPFDVDMMRKLISQLVDEAKDQKISQFLEFPESIKSHFVEDEQPNTPMESFDAQEPEVELKLDSEDKDSYTPESTSEFNIQAEDTEFEISNYEVKPYEPAGPTADTTEINLSQSSSNDSTDDDEPWVVTSLREETTDDKPNEQNDMDHFESMDLQGNKKLNLDDFLYKPESANSPTPEPKNEIKPINDNHSQPTGLSQVANVQIAGSQNTSTNIHQQISPEEMEAIIRQETRMMIKDVIKEQLPAMLEKVIREELEKVLEQELALKAANPNL